MDSWRRDAPGRSSRPHPHGGPPPPSPPAHPPPPPPGRPPPRPRAPPRPHPRRPRRCRPAPRRRAPRATSSLREPLRRELERLGKLRRERLEADRVDELHGFRLGEVLADARPARVAHIEVVADDRR